MVHEGQWILPWESYQNGTSNGERIVTITARELTPREQEVVDLVVSGMACKDIASTLEISPKTVNVHLKSSFIKLGVHSRVELVGKALRGQIADLKSQLTEAKGRR